MKTSKIKNLILIISIIFIVNIISIGTVNMGQNRSQNRENTNFKIYTSQ